MDFIKNPIGKQLKKQAKSIDIWVIKTKKIGYNWTWCCYCLP